jgi:cell division protein FtsL
MRAGRFSFQRKEKSMKKFIIVAILVVLLPISSQAAWFGNTNEEQEKERRIEAQARSTQLEQQLDQQRQITDKWQIATGGFAVGCIALLTIGAALGTKVKRDGNKT